MMEALKEVSKTERLPDGSVRTEKFVLTIPGDILLARTTITRTLITEERAKTIRENSPVIKVSDEYVWYQGRSDTILGLRGVQGEGGGWQTEMCEIEMRQYFP